MVPTVVIARRPIHCGLVIVGMGVGMGQHGASLLHVRLVLSTRACPNAIDTDLSRLHERSCCAVAVVLDGCTSPVLHGLVCPVS